jgi:hypothetical protein
VLPVERAIRQAQSLDAGGVAKVHVELVDG